MRIETQDRPEDVSEVLGAVTGIVGAVMFEDGQPLLDIGGKTVRMNDIKSIVDTSLLDMLSGQ